jgi:acyl-CoA dehydrogenase
MISFALEEDQRLIQDTVRKLAAEELRPRLRELERAGDLPPSLREQFFQLGLGLLDVPEALSGLGASRVTAALVHEELAFGDPGAALALCAPHLAAQALLCLGEPAQQERLLARFAAADGAQRLGALAYGERDAPVEGFRTTARRAGDHFILDGGKSWVVNGGRADLHVVFAQLEGTSGWDGVAAFVVEAGNPGLRAGARHELLGLETVHAAEIVLAGCRVPDRDRLTGGADFRRGVAELFARAGLANAARQVGLARAAYEYALSYTQERKAFGKPVAHFQAIAFELAGMAMDVDAARWMVWRAARSLDEGRLGVEVPEAIAHANEAAWRVADHAVQLLGGAGYVQDHPVEKWLRDTKALALFGLPSETAHLAIASLELGSPIVGLPSAGLQPFFT